MALRFRTGQSLLQQCRRLVHAPPVRATRFYAFGVSVALLGYSSLPVSTGARRLISSSIAHAHAQSSGSSAGEVKEAPPSKDLLRELNNYRVVDVREPHERVETGFVPGSINIPLDKILTGTTEVPKDKPLLMVCNGGRRSMRAAAALNSRGYKDVTNLATGTMGWIQAGLPVERFAPKEIKEVFPSKELNATLSSYTVIDVREPNERVETGFVPTSVNRPLATIIDGSASLPSGKPFLMVCRSGKRSLKASEALASRGMDVTNLAEGTLGWIAAGLPVDHVN